MIDIGRFAILGPLVVRDEAGTELALNSPKQRALLAALLVRPNLIVPADELVELIWPDGGDGAQATLRSYVMRLRRSLGPLGTRLETIAPGYRFTVDEERELDLTAFTRLGRTGRAAAQAGDWARAAQSLGRALELWRGEPLLDVACPPLHDRTVPPLVELYRQVRELHCEAELELGRPGEAVADLRALIQDEPLRERPYAVLMTALSRLERRAEALEVFRAARAALRGELGVEPGRTLQELHRRILAAEHARSPDRPEPERDGAGPARAALPSGATFFTGREAEVQRLLELLEPGAGSASRPALVAISGMGGTGKTSLALHIAELTRRSFPDGQVYVNLRGSQESGRSASGTEAGLLLRELGVPAGELPAGSTARLELLRERLTDRRVLLVLDDAADAAHIRPLLPSLSGGAVLVTSRKQLSGLPDAAHVSLEGMEREASRRLLTRLIGAQRVERERAAVEQLMDLCADLPLALRLAGSRLATRPRWAVSDLCESMRSARSRLDELSFGDESVRTAFEVAYLRLGRQDLRRLFCLVGMTTGAELGLPAVSALAGRPAAELEADLEYLTDACLLQSSAPGRYGAHDLLREYAAERGAADLPAGEREAALIRLLSWYVLAAAALDKAITPKRSNPPITLDHVPEGLPPLPEFADTLEAVAWGRAEELNIRAAVRLAAASGDRRLWELGWQVPFVLRFFYMNQRDLETAVDLMAVGAGLARRLGSLEAESRVRTNLAILLLQAGRFQEAIEHLERNLAVCIELDRPEGAVHVRVNLGIAFAESGRLDAAAAQFEQVLVHCREVGDLLGQFQAWSNIAELRRRSGDATGALEACDRAEEVYRTAHEKGTELEYRDALLVTKAESLREAGRLAPAAEAADESVRLRRAGGDRHGLLESLRVQGECLAELGHPRAAALLAEADELELELKAAVSA